MGAVHGVHMKYVAASAASATGALYATPAESEVWWWRVVHAGLCYAAVAHAIIAILFISRRGARIIGKDSQSGAVPAWSYVVWFAFHSLNYAYTLVHNQISSVPAASEVMPGWWLGGRYAHTMRGRRWEVITATPSHRRA